MRSNRLYAIYRLRVKNPPVAAIAYAAWIAASATGEVGDVRSTIRPFVSAGQEYSCALGLAFDGTNLFLSRCGYSVIDVIESPGDCPQAPATCPVDWSFDTQVPEGVSGLAFDAKRNGVWIGTQAGQGQEPFDGCGSIGMPIYFWSFNGPGTEDDEVLLKYTVPRDLVNPATLQHVFALCNLTGLAYLENDASRDDDDELWLVDVQSHNVVRFRLDGSCPAGVLNEACASGFDARLVDPSLFLRCSGLATTIERVALSTAGCELCLLQGIEESDVFRAIETPGGLKRVDQLVADVGRWKADMECDAVTFAPDHVMWVRTSPQGDSAKNLITAYEIESGGCGQGGPVGACCVSATVSCMNKVSEAACQSMQGTWTEGATCQQVSGCVAHEIVLLDRTGSMREIRSATGNTRCVDALETAKFDVDEFFATHSAGSSLAVWTFSHEPGAATHIDLTAGFVTDAATATDALNNLDGVECTGGTPLAEAMCDAVDVLTATFPFATDMARILAVSSDGGENFSEGQCAGPDSLSGSTCDNTDPFSAGSWQQLACGKIVGDAVAEVRYWGFFGEVSTESSSSIDPETGTQRSASVSDAAFFTALANATGGSILLLNDDPPPVTGSSIFGVVGACCLPNATCQESITEAECAVLSGLHQGAASTCAVAGCGPVVPTTSDWGVLVLAFSVLSMGTIIVRRRRLNGNMIKTT